LLRGEEAAHAEGKPFTFRGKLESAEREPGHGMASRVRATTIRVVSSMGMQYGNYGIQGERVTGIRKVIVIYKLHSRKAKTPCIPSMTCRPLHSLLSIR